MTDTADVVDEHEELLLALEEFLQSKKCQLWGASFTVWEEKGRRAAAEWIARLLDEIAEWEPEED